MIKQAMAQAILRECGGTSRTDFHALESTAVEALLRWADAVKYRKPTNANGSRARYFHAYLQRRAAKGE